MNPMQQDPPKRFEIEEGPEVALLILSADAKIVDPQKVRRGMEIVREDFGPDLSEGIPNPGSLEVERIRPTRIFRSRLSHPDRNIVREVYSIGLSKEVERVLGIGYDAFEKQRIEIDDLNRGVREWQSNLLALEKLHNDAVRELKFLRSAGFFRRFRWLLRGVGR